MMLTSSEQEAVGLSESGCGESVSNRNMYTRCGLRELPGIQVRWSGILPDERRVVSGADRKTRSGKPPTSYKARLSLHSGISRSATRRRTIDVGNKNHEVVANHESTWLIDVTTTNRMGSNRPVRTGATNGSEFKLVFLISQEVNAMNAFITMTKDYQSALRTMRFFIRRGIPCLVRKRSDGSYALFTYAGYSLAVRNLRKQMSA